MKRNITRATTLFFLLALAAASAHAQSAGGRLRGHIPFQFVVSGKTLPAGDYVIERINRQTIRETLLIRSVDGRSRALVSTSPVYLDGRREQARLIFRRYGEQRFLSELRGGESDMGLQMPKCGAELALERELRKPSKERTGDAVAKKAAEPTTVAVLLSRK